MGKTDCFTQFYPTGFTHWVKLPCQPWLCCISYLFKLKMHSTTELTLSLCVIVCGMLVSVDVQPGQPDFQLYSASPSELVTSTVDA